MTPETSILICLLAPFFGAVGALLAFRRRGVAAAIAGLATLASLGAALNLVAATATGEVFAISAGGWEAPYGIVLVADGFSALMLAVCQLVILAAVVFAWKTLGSYESRRHLFPLMMTLALGVNGAFLTGDLFNLYVWFEVLLLSSFALMALVRGEAGRGGAWRYVVINLISSFLFLAGAGLIYGKTGTLNFADLHLRLQASDDSFLIGSSAGLLLAAFGIKSALVPFAFWLPVSYPRVPPALGALFAGLLTKVGLYALFRIFGFVFAKGGTFPHQEVLLGLAVLTMVVGVFGAVGQGGMRGILSFHIISQVGYMALALALFTPFAMAAGIFYLVHHIVVKANLFLVTALVEETSGNSEIGKTSGLMASAPWVAGLFAIPALSLAGIPPLSGFFAKFALLGAALEGSQWFAAAAIVLVGLLTIFSMLKIWKAIFWGEGGEVKKLPGSLLATSACLGAVTLGLGIFAGPVFEISRQAAENLMNPEPYLEAVLGPEEKR